MNKDELITKWENVVGPRKRKMLDDEEKLLPPSPTLFVKEILRFDHADRNVILERMKATFAMTLQRQLHDSESQTKMDIDRISTQLRKKHIVLVSGFKKSPYLKTTLSAIVKSYNKDRCVEVSDASQWDYVDPKYVSLVLFVHPFGENTLSHKKARTMITLLDIIKETHKKDRPVADVVMVTDQSVFKAFTAQYSHDLLENPICLLQTTNERPLQQDLNASVPNFASLGATEFGYHLFRDESSRIVPPEKEFGRRGLDDFSSFRNKYRRFPHAERLRKYHSSMTTGSTDLVLTDDQRSTVTGGHDSFPEKSSRFVPPEIELGRGLEASSPSHTSMTTRSTDRVLRDDQRSTVIGGVSLSTSSGRLFRPENELGRGLHASFPLPEYIDCSLTRLILSENIVKTCMKRLKESIEEIRSDIKVLDIQLKTEDSEQYLDNSIDLSSMRHIQKLNISHATEKEILSLSKFQGSLSNIKYLLIQGPERCKNTAALKLSKRSIGALFRLSSRLESLSLRNILMDHAEILKLLQILGHSETLRELELINITCKDEYEQCQGFHIDLQKARCLTKIDIVASNIVDLSCLARYLDKPITVIAGSLISLSLHVQYEQVFTIAFIEQLKLLVCGAPNLKTVYLQGMVIGQNKIQSIKISKEDLQRLIEDNNEINHVQLFTKVIGGQIDFRVTNFDVFDFLIECEWKHSFSDSVILNFICHELVTTYPKEFDEAYASLICSHDSLPTLICILKEPIPIHEFRGFCLETKMLENISKSSIKAEHSVDKDSDEYKLVVDTWFEDLNITLGYHSQQLMLNHSNIEAIRASFIKAKNEDEGEICPCIVIYCKAKSLIPYKEKQFPKKLKHPTIEREFKTDIREGYFSFCTGESQKWNKELAMGCSIGESNCDVGATMGPFVNVIETGKTCFLTVRHVFQPLSRPDESILGVKVVQPSDVYIPQILLKEKKECGTVIASQLGKQIDAALIEISPDRLPLRGNFVTINRPKLQMAGLSQSDQLTFDDGSSIDAKLLSVRNRATRRIIKVGSNTSLTKGSLLTTDGCVRETVEYMTMEHKFNGRKETFEVMSQIFVDSYYKDVFLQSGDSGAAVFLMDDDNKLSCIGMLIGMLTDYTGVVTPINNILNILGRQYGKQLELKKFVFPQMDTS